MVRHKQKAVLPGAAEVGLSVRAGARGGAVGGLLFDWTLMIQVAEAERVGQIVNASSVDVSSVDVSRLNASAVTASAVTASAVTASAVTASAKRLPAPPSSISRVAGSSRNTRVCL